MRPNTVRLETLRDFAARRFGGLADLVRGQRSDPSSLALHKCAGYGCLTMIARDRLMCVTHWDFLPTWLQQKLADAYNPQDEFAWPLNLVEQAIRTTITADELKGILSQVEQSLQDDLFEESRCGIEVCHSHLHCDLCDLCSVTTKACVAIERFSSDRVDIKACNGCMQIVVSGRHAVFESVGQVGAWRQEVR